MMGGGFDMGWGGFGFGFGMLLFWVLVVLGIVVLVKWLVGGRPSEPGSRGRALEILKERYAKGELTGEQFEQMKRALGD